MNATFSIDTDEVHDYIKSKLLLSQENMKKLTKIAITSILLEFYAWQYVNQRFFNSTSLTNANFSACFNDVRRKLPYDQNIVYAVLNALVGLVSLGKLANKYLQPKKEDALSIMKDIDKSYMEKFLKKITDIGQNALEVGYKKIIVPIILVGALMGGIYAYGKSK